MKLSFMNRVAIQVPQKRGVCKKILVTCGIISALITLLMVYMEGFSGVEFLSGIFLPAFLLWRGFQSSYSLEYIQVEAELSVLDTDVTLEYPHIKRMLDGEVRYELYRFRLGDITSFQYSESLCAIRIVGTPYISIKENVFDEEDCRVTHNEQEVVMYLPEDKIMSVIDAIESCHMIHVEKMDAD